VTLTYVLTKYLNKIHPSIIPPHLSSLLLRTISTGFVYIYKFLFLLQVSVYIHKVKYIYPILPPLLFLLTLPLPVLRFISYSSIKLL
jgi:hypothetical protein